MKLITNTYNPSDLDGFSYAFIELTPDLARLILKRRDVFKSIPPDETSRIHDLTAMEYHDCSAMFLNGVPEGTDLPNTDEGTEFDEVTLTPEDLENFAERTDCDRMVIVMDAVYWTAYPHYADKSLTVETCQIDYPTIERAALSI